MTSRIETLRTPEERFVKLPNYTFGPHYLDDLKGYEGLRVHTVDERPARPATNMQTYLCLHGEPTWAYLYRKMIPEFGRPSASWFRKGGLWPRAYGPRC